MLPLCERKNWLKLLGMAFQHDPCCWELQVDTLLSKAACRMYILRICRSYSYTKENLNLLFETVILSLFQYGDLLYRINIYNELINYFDELIDSDTL